MKIPIPSLLVALALAGCATPFRAPADVAHIKLERGDSPVLLVDKVWLERKSGPLVVRGYVIRRTEGADTKDSHLDITLFDASGRELRSTVGRFTPQEIVHVRPHPDLASYEVVLDPLPPGTARILVQAHEGRHP